MQRKLFLMLFLTALVPALLLGAGKGKIRGKVTDAGTGEPLIGANVVVTGTSQGAATNAAGEFMILNVDAGTYQLRTTYVGYQTITVDNVRVNSDLTTEQNFQLPAEGVQVATVEITAERPLVNKNATNAVRIIDQDFFTKLPSRGVNAAITLQPGVVQQNNNIYIRGGRADEVGYRVENVGVNDVLLGGRALNVTAEAVEQIQVQAGGFNAEYGGANAGLVQTQLRTGGPDRWKASVLGETDRYTGAAVGKKAMGGYSYGYSDMTATFGGPVPVLGNKIRFFGSVENTFQRDRDPSVRSPIVFTGANAVMSDPQFTPAHPDTGENAVGMSDALNINTPAIGMGGSDNRWITMGTLLFDLSPIQVRLAGSYSYNRYRTQTFLANIFNTSRLALNIARDGFANIRVTHVVTPTLYYEGNFNYFANSFVTEDPDFLGNIFAYGDSAANAAIGYRMRENSTDPNWKPWNLWGGAFAINQPGAQVAGYDQRSQRSLGGRLDFTSQMKQHEVKFGGEYTRYTIRRYNPANEITWFGLRNDIPNPQDLEVSLATAGGIGLDAYGFDVYHNKIENDVVLPTGGLLYLAPRHPVFAAAYVQDKVEFSDLVLNLGLRFDYINPDSKDVADPSNLHFDKNNLIMANDVVKTAATSQVSPRIGFSFPVSDRTVFHAQYGKFIQQTQLRDSYVGATQMAGIIKGGFFVQGTWGWGLKPTRTTQYELGFSQAISDIASFDITAFYKDIQDQVTWRNVAPAAGSEGQNYGELVNADYSTAKGFEVKFTLRRTQRITAQVNYTFSDTRTTGSNTSSTAGLWSAGSIISLPKYVFPADFNQPHRGSVLFDYRFGKNDGGPVLEQLGLNVVASFNSGHSFTRVIAQQRGPAPGDPRFRQPVEPVGSSMTPWFFQMDARLDKTFSLGALDLNVYVYVINLLGTDNPVNAFFRTGDPRDDGWFATPDGANDARNQGAQYVQFYQAVNNGENSGNWGPPRQIRFGLRLDY